MSGGDRFRPQRAPWPTEIARDVDEELESLRGWLRDEYPKDNERFRTAAFHLMGPIGPPPLGRDMMTKVVGLAAGSASALVLLIACGNVAGLLLVRAVGRRGEIGIRKALGAGRWRLVRQQIAESLILWIMGGAAALGVVLALNRAANLGSLVGPAGLDLTPSLDWRVLAFAAGVTLLVGLLSSIGPALRATRAEAAETLRAAGQIVTQRTAAGTLLAVFQLSASLTLLIGAYLLAGTLAHLSRVPLGFDADGLFLFPIQPGSVGYTDTAALEYVNEFQRRLAGVAGVRGVAAANGAPFVGGSNLMRRARAADTADGPAIEIHSNSLFSTSYFAAVGIPLVRGRLFTDADMAAGRRGDARAVILSENLARHLFGAADPIGRAIEFPRQRSAAERYEVIGVVGTARYRDLVTPADEMLYEAAGPTNMGIASGATMIVRTDGTVALAAQAGAIATALNPALPLTRVLPMTEAVGRARADWDSLALIIGVLATLATVLACIGLYGVVAHGVAQRRREMGVRLALGATPRQIWRTALRGAAAMTGTGLALGLAGGYAFARVLSTRLVGVDPMDPALWGLAACSLVGVAALASIVPARAAARIDVTEILRTL